MKINWDYSAADIQNVKDFIKSNSGPFVESRRNRNVEKQNIIVNRDSVIKCMMMCLLTSQQRSGPNSIVGFFLRQNPFPITAENVDAVGDIEKFAKQILIQHRLLRFIDRISSFFAENINKFSSDNWKIIDELKKLRDNQSKETERELADYLSKNLRGFGPKQSRNFLQALGLTKFEIPIDSRITNWLNKNGFPVSLTSGPLGDIGYYHFVSDGIQNLCEKAGVYPCILDAAIFSSYDNGKWTKDNIVY